MRACVCAPSLLLPRSSQAHIGSHTHVVSLIGAVTAGTPKLLVMNFCENGALQEYLKERASSASPFTDAERLKAAHDVAQGMMHLEAKRVVHRDLAARNVLVDSLFRCKVVSWRAQQTTRAHGTLCHLGHDKRMRMRAHVRNTQSKPRRTFVLSTLLRVVPSNACLAHAAAHFGTLTGRVPGGLWTQQGKRGRGHRCARLLGRGTQHAACLRRTPPPWLQHYWANALSVR